MGRGGSDIGWGWKRVTWVIGRSLDRLWEEGGLILVRDGRGLPGSLGGH